MMIPGRKDYVWNSIAGVINAGEAVVMSMVVTRCGKLSDAGVLLLAFAIGNVLMTVGKFGGRMFQVTDTNGQYSFSVYLAQRLCAIVLMLLAMVGVLAWGGYVGEKHAAIICIALIYAVESLEDCFWGYCQASNRLYIGAQMFTTRWLAILFVFTFVMAFSHDLAHALSLAAIVSGLVFGLWLYLLNRHPKVKCSFEGIIGIIRNYRKQLLELFRQMLPLFLASFCSLFLITIPKLAIDRHMNDESQACFGFVLMPVFVIGLLNQFIYQPMVVNLAMEYNNGRIDQVSHNVRKQMLITTGIAALCVVGSAIIGIPALSVIYGTDLLGYWNELLILQFAGGFLALSGYFIVLLTLMRKQNDILIGHIGALTLGLIVFYPIVKSYGTIGASLGYLLIMIALFVFYYSVYRKTICQRG